MGQEIESANFGRSNAAEFARRLARETDDVVRWGAEGRFLRARPQIGVEVEACLVDERFHALPINEKFLSRLADPHATIELARFNVEFNPPPIPLAGDAFDRLRAVLGDIMTRAFDVAESFDARILLAGILPTLTPGDLESRLISKSRRYRAFAAKFASWQKSRMARVEIPDNEGLVVGVNSVIMESVTTSQQIHLQIPEPGSGAYYNAAQLVAAPMVAVGANSPFFMGRDLWAESRVPVFEQVLGPRFAAGGGDDFFGRGYVEESALEIFVHNRERLPVILPELREEENGCAHLSLHNGTIWRWNRPVISFADDGRPILRIEHRALPSGPTVADICANAAFFAGAVRGLVDGELAGLGGADVERRLPFARARQNFYACARDGLDAEVAWLDGATTTARALICDTLAPLAETALLGLGIDAAGVKRELEIVAGRAASGQTGAAWQRAQMKKNGGGSPGVAKMVAAYHRRQMQNRPVHEWGA